MAYIADANDAELQKVYALLSVGTQSSDYDLSESQLAFLNEERQKHISGKSKSYSWDEVKDSIRKKRAS